MAISNTVSTVWGKMITDTSYKTTVMAQLVSRNYESEIKGAGETVKIMNREASIPVANYVQNTTISYYDLVPNTTDLDIDQQKYWAFRIDDVDKVQSAMDLKAEHIEPAAKSIRDVIDTHLITTAYSGVQAANAISTANSPFTLTAANIYDKITELSQKLTESNCPMSGRHMVVSPRIIGLLQQSDAFQRASDLGDKTTLTGEIGQMLGMKVHMSQNLPDNLGTGTATTPILAFTKNFVQHAGQVSKMEEIRDKDTFGEYIRGLFVYGSVVPASTVGNGAVLYGTI